MEFKNSQSYRCFNSICICSLFADLIIILVFFIGYALTCIVAEFKGNDFAQGFGYIAILAVPLILKLIFLLCFVVAVGYFFFILYLEYRKKTQNLPLAIVNKTEQSFNKFIKRDLIKKALIILSRLSFIINVPILITFTCAILFQIYIFIVSSLLNYIWASE